MTSSSRVVRGGRVASGRRALVRRPSPRLAEGLLTHIERTPVDPDLATRQWHDYVRALRNAGWRTIEVPQAPELPDSAFVEDTMVVFGDFALVSRPGAPSRRPEIEAAERTVTEAGYQPVRVEEPGTLDGGDVLTVGDLVYVGLGGRTNADGAEQLRRHLEPRGRRVVPVPVTKVLHLKSAVTALPDGTVIGHRPLVDDPAVFPDFLAVPEEAGAHVVVIGADTVLMSASAPRTRAMLEARGLDVVTVDISEFERLEGCVTCLSVRLRG